MTIDRRSVLAVVAGLAALAVVGVAMSSLSYDVWGAMIIAPLLAFASAPLIQRAFGGRYAALVPYVWAGLAAKLVGTVLGYVVRFDAYGGNADAGRYHASGRTLAAGVRSGTLSPLEVVPTSSDTEFIEQVNGLVYTFAGSSRVGGFLIFAWFSFIGTLLVLRAVLDAVPGLAQRRYVCLLMFTPSLMYWGSSPGKEAVIGLLLGLTTIGAAGLLREHGRRGGALIACAVGLGLAARIRPHFAAIWAAALVAALIVKLATEVVRTRKHSGRPMRTIAVALSIVLAVAGFAGISAAALSALDPLGDEGVASSVTDRVGNIFERTEAQTSQGGSNFETVSIDNPVNWPLAAARTLTRPLLIEARSIATMLPAIEMTVLLALLVASWRRLRNLPTLVMREPFLVFVVSAVLMFGVAFSSIGNLGILVRQRSLVLPLMLVLWCVPEWQGRSSASRAAASSSKSTTAMGSYA